MLQNTESYADSLRMQNMQLEKQRIELSDKIAGLDHQKRKQLLENRIQIRTQLQFERRKAAQFQMKFQEELKNREDNIRYKSISIELSDQLNLKENQIQDLKKKDFEKKQIIAQLESIILQIKNKPSQKSQEQIQAIKQIIQQNTNLKQQIIHMREGALNAIIQKDNIIQQLEQKIKAVMEMAGGLELIQLKQRYIELEDKFEKSIKQYEQSIYHKDNEILQLSQRIQQLKFKSQERVSRLEQDINEYESYIERLKQEKMNEHNLVSSLDDLQETNRKYQKKIQDLEIMYNQEKNNKQIELRTLKSKIQKERVFQKELEKQRSLKKELQHQKKQLTQQNVKLLKKIEGLENEKQILKDSLEDYKNYKNQLDDSKKQYNELLEEKLKIQSSLQQIKQNFRALKSQLLQQKVNSSQNINSLNEIEEVNQFQIERDTLKSQLSNQKDFHEQISLTHSQSFTEKLKIQDRLKQLQLESNKSEIKITQLKQRIIELQDELKNKTADNRILRNKMLEGVEAINKLQANNLSEIEKLKSYLNKVENNLLILKLKHAQDEYFWAQRTKNDRIEFAKKEQKLNKQKAQLYEKIDRLRKKGPQKKSQFYQSSLK